MKKTLLFIVLTVTALLIVAFDNKNNESSAVDSRELNGNNIHTWFRTNGSFNRNPQTGNAGFEWPQGTGKTARYASGLWIGAQVGSDTLMAIASYGYEYLPGYTDGSGVPQGFDSSVYRIYRMDFGVSNSDRQNWPSILLGNSNQDAPVDYDSLSGLLGPAEFGRQTMYYVYTDSYASVHNDPAGSTAPLKADIRQLNFAPAQSGNLSNVIFSQFIIINRSTQIWHNAIFSMWTDDDLGSSEDDVIGCDSSRKMGYTYNATNNDGIYGEAPPAVATILLKGALKYTGNSTDVAVYCVNHERKIRSGYKDVGMTAFNPNGIPSNYIQTYRIMNGLTNVGGVVINPSGGFPTKLYYSGDPVAGTGWRNTTGAEQRFILSSGPVDVAPGDTQVVTMAQIVGRGSSNINSIAVLREYADDAKDFYNSCYGHKIVGINENEISQPEKFVLYQNFPNPFNPETKIKYSLPERSNVSLTIFDASGKEVSMIINKTQDRGKYETVFDASGLSSGIYFYVLKASANNKVFRESKRMLLIK